MDRKVGNGTLTPPLHTKMQIQLVLAYILIQLSTINVKPTRQTQQ